MNSHLPASRALTVWRIKMPSGPRACLPLLAWLDYGRLGATSGHKTTSASVRRAAVGRIGRTYEGGNRLLDALPSAERADIVPALEVVDLAAGITTHAPDASYDWVVFPIDAVLSVITTLEDGETAEVGTVGNEGASGVEIAFGAPVLRTTICQVEGSVARMRTTAFLDAIDRHAGLDALVHSTEKGRMFFVEQMIVCNTVHSLQQRRRGWRLLG